MEASGQRCTWAPREGIHWALPHVLERNPPPHPGAPASVTGHNFVMFVMTVFDLFLFFLTFFFELTLHLILVFTFHIINTSTINKIKLFVRVLCNYYITPRSARVWETQENKGTTCWLDTFVLLNELSLDGAQANRGASWTQPVCGFALRPLPGRQGCKCLEPH